MTSEKLQQQYSLLTDQSGFVVLPKRCHLLLTGDDRSKFLNNFCTANISELSAGQGAELFILDTRGKTIAFGHVFNLQQGLLISTAAGDQSNSLMQHLDKYVIREDVSITDQSDSTASVFVIGKLSAEKLGVSDLDQNQTSSIEFGRLIAHVELAGFGFLINCDVNETDKLVQHLESLGIGHCELDALQSVRHEYGTPWTGFEIDESNLPQELRRDEKAISFTKGCYLGQETVAKIDAFGHVNKFMVAVQITEGGALEQETEIQIDGSKIGTIKTVAFSSKLKSSLALGFVKCKFADPGTEVSIGKSKGKIASLPIH